MDFTQQTKTKYIHSGMKGFSDLGNAFGSLNAVLKTALGQVYNVTPVISVEHNLTETSKIFLGINHGFLSNQVIKLTSTSQNLNKEYRIIEIGTDFIIINYSIELSAAYTDLEVAGAGLNHEIVYEDSSAGVICYKNRTTKSPCILKVIDQLPPNDYSANWVKFARVVIGNELDLSTGEFIDNLKVPYLSYAPDAESVGNGVSGSKGIHGYSKWPYAFSSTSKPKEIDRPNDAFFPAPWIIIGDEISFYLMINSRGINSSNLYGYSLYGTGNFFSYNEKETYNSYISASTYFLSAETEHSENFGRGYNYIGGLSSTNSFALLADITGRCGRNSYGSVIGNSFNSSIPSLDTIKSFTKDNILSSKMYIRDNEGYLRGHFRGTYNFYGTDTLPDCFVDSKGYIYLTLQSPYSSTKSNKISQIFDLKDWEVSA